MQSSQTLREEYAGEEGGQSRLCARAGGVGVRRTRGLAGGLTDGGVGH